MNKICEICSKGMKPRKNGKFCSPICRKEGKKLLMADYRQAYWDKLRKEGKMTEFNQARYQNHKEQRDEYQKKYNFLHKEDENFKEKRKARRMKNHYLHPEKDYARDKLVKAVLSGKVIKPKVCEGCLQEKRLEGHHDDYTKPLDVKWLCKKCHENLHHACREEFIRGINEIEHEERRKSKDNK